MNQAFVKGRPPADSLALRSEAGEARQVARQGLGKLLAAKQERPFVELCCAIEARRTPMANVIVQFTAPVAGTGTTTAASGYARVAAVQSYQPVLYVAWSRPTSRRGAPSGETTSLLEAFRRGSSLEDATVPVRDAQNLLWAQLFSGPDPLLEVGPSELNALLSAIRARYALTVLDCPPCNSPEAAAISRFVDGSIIVAAANRTRKREIDEATMRIERAGGQIVGLVFNRQRRILPRWLDSRL